MPDQAHRIVTIAMAIAAFGLIGSLWFAGVLIWFARRTREIEQRLQFVQPQQGQGSGRILRLWHEGREATTLVPGVVRIGLRARLEKMRVDAGWEAPLGAAISGVFGITALVAIVGYLITSSGLVAVLTPIALLLVCWIYLKQRIARRAATFERQLIDSLELAARSLRAGHPLVGSFRLISEEIPAPVGDLFGEIVQQQALGVPLDRAIRNAADQSSSEDLKLFATSVVIQLRSGGNLADMMERLAAVIRERNRLTRRVRVLTAQTQFSKNVLLALPFLVFVLLNVVNPKYMRPLYTTFTGQIIMAAAASGLMLGWLMMNWLSKLTQSSGR